MNFLIGIGFIILGVWSLVFTYKNPDSQLSSADWKGYLGGVCAIIIGIFILLNKFTL